MVVKLSRGVLRSRLKAGAEQGECVGFSPVFERLDDRLQRLTGFGQLVLDRGGTSAGTIRFIKSLASFEFAELLRQDPLGNNLGEPCCRPIVGASPTMATDYGFGSPERADPR